MKGKPKEDCGQWKQCDLTFPFVLQQQWEVSRRYAMFATPIAYSIDQDGIITQDVAVGMESILRLATAISDQANSSRNQVPLSQV